MDYIIPIVLTVILISAIVKKQPPYKLFCEGASEGGRIIIKIFPPILAVLTAAAMLRASGAIDMLCGFIEPLLNKLNIPQGTAPLILLKPLSGSGSLGILSDILKEYGPDSVEGRVASVICASTETTFYCLMVYFADTRVKKTLKAVPCAIIGDIVGILAAAAVVKYM